MVTVNKPLNKAVIPHQVRFDRLLNAAEKMFYGELVALCGSKNHCWAKHAYFAALYGKSTKSISRWLKKLVKLGYVRVVINREMFDRREVHLVSLQGTNERPAVDRHVQGEGQKSPYNNNDNKKNDSYNDESEWDAHTQVTNSSFSFSNGATPTVEQVRACMKQLPDELTAGVDLVEESRKFYVNYTATGWMMGSAKMKSLPAAVEKWITNTHSFNRKQTRPNEHNSQYNTGNKSFSNLTIKRHHGTKF